MFSFMESHSIGVNHALFWMVREFKNSTVIGCVPVTLCISLLLSLSLSCFARSR